jgi:hypothetical protein
MPVESAAEAVTGGDDLMIWECESVGAVSTRATPVRRVGDRIV